MPRDLREMDFQRLWRRLQQIGLNAYEARTYMVLLGQPRFKALELASRLNLRAPNALASLKELVNDADGATLTRHLSAERDHFVRNLHHPNGGIGIAAFLGKHPARYE